MKQFTRMSAILIVFAFIGGAAHAQDVPLSPCIAPEIKVVATVGMIADMVRNIGGECTQVTALMGAGVDPPVQRDRTRR